MLKVGVVGLGVMGKNHVRVIRSIPELCLVGVFDQDPTTARDLVLPGEMACDSLRELFELSLDYCVIATPTMTHCDIAHIALNSGTAALIEKPLAGTHEEAAQLARQFDSAGVLGVVGHIERFNPAIRLLKEKLKEGSAGRVYQVSTRRHGPLPIRITDVGVIDDLMTHDVDIVRWLFDSDYARVAAHSVTAIGQDTEDLVSVIGLLESGIIATHSTNWLSPAKERRTVVTAQEGTYVADTVAADLTFYANAHWTTEWEAMAAFRGVGEGDVTRFAVEKIEPLLTEHRQFIGLLAGDTSSSATLEEAAKNVLTCDAIRASCLLNGSPIQVGELHSS